MILEKETFELLSKSFENASQKAKIVCKCDFCEKIFSRLKHNIERSLKISNIISCDEKICVQKKRIESNKIKFGTENAFQNKEIKDKIAQKNIEVLGVANPMQHPDIKEKHKKTIQNKYGTNNVFQNKDIKDKIKKKFNDTLGVDNPMQNTVIRKKQQDKLIENFGVPYALQDPELRKKAMDTCISNFGHFPANNYGKTQKDMENWLNSFGFNFKSNRNIIPGSEIDLYDDSKKLGIEYCGLHWHHEFSPEPRGPKYHHNKYKKCLDQGIQLLTIWSDEWERRRIQCEGHIKSILGINDKRIYARKCQIQEINKELGRQFFDDYHIQGRNLLGIVFFGLIHENELVGVMSLGRHHRNYDFLVLDRLCFKNGVQIVGGASKLFSTCVEWAKTTNYKEILSFSDNRWSLGRVYNALNFGMVKDYNPDYSYVDIKLPNKRWSKQSQKKTLTDCPDELTEYDWAHHRGLARIWDCGKKRWIFKL